MGYFPNGEAGERYETKYCEHCVHYGDPEQLTGCPIMMLHLMWNYDAVGHNADETKKLALDMLIPPAKGQPWNDQCTMFWASGG